MQLLCSLPESEKTKFQNNLSDEEKLALLYDWEKWARVNQLPPVGDWFIWLLLSGRGFGKTRALSEVVRQWASEGYTPIALVGQTKADVRDTIVELGDSSILKISPPWFMPEYEPSKRRLTWPNGVQAVIYSGDEPDQLRGPQHAKAAVDELAKFLYPQQTWDNLLLGLRTGKSPQCVVATTPRPIKIIKELMQDSIRGDKRVTVTRGHTLDNKFNLAPQFLSHIIQKYEGTRLGRQELAGEILSSLKGLVYDAFDSEACIIPRFALPQEWPRYFGQDFGRVNTAALWYAMEPGTGFLYCYREYLQKASLTKHVKSFQESSKNETFRRKVGGNLQEENVREAYSLAGWHLTEPRHSNDVKARIVMVNSLHAHNKVYYFSDLAGVLDEKMSFAYEVDKEDMMQEKIHNESSFHYMSAEGYILSEISPVESIDSQDKKRVKSFQPYSPGG